MNDLEKKTKGGIVGILKNHMANRRLGQKLGSDDAFSLEARMPGKRQAHQSEVTCLKAGSGEGAGQEA